eukprot:CAMPEP_0170606006 /NCGR_PEP_ID=MMETSP0224-20130122/20274_1 /TAXON_ID=285029 /ORGANISM="Togula jolla, Strain CCCM 725" /LENGTH=304 /DNA_ID=CAMNT_0010931043 /DNA_START=30 /DNA_END=944 /DNA_ORIENTATION=-
MRRVNSAQRCHGASRRTVIWAGILVAALQSVLQRAWLCPQVLTGPLRLAGCRKSSGDIAGPRGSLDSLARQRRLQHWPSRPEAPVRGASIVRAAAQPLFLGIGEALTTIFFSEVGDKTFFLTMILASRKGVALALLCSQSALWLMTGLSVTMGLVLRTFPERFGNMIVVNICAALLMIVFGVQSLREMPSKEAVHENKGEMTEAEVEIEQALHKDRHPILSWLRFSVIIFLAEWGDRSMFTTVTLAATKSPFGVLLGGCCGHLAAAMIAVASGGLLRKYLNDRIIKRVSGILFIVFGISTLLEI